MRSVHFISFAWFVLFILAHGIMVFVTGLRENTNHMFRGVDNDSWAGFPLFVLAMSVMTAAWLLVSPFTTRHARLVQRIGGFMIGWLKALAERPDPQAQLTEKDISPFFWPNGTMPDSKEYASLVGDGFSSYRLRISGLVEAPQVIAFLAFVNYSRMVTSPKGLRGHGIRLASSRRVTGRMRPPGLKPHLRSPC